MSENQDTPDEAVERVAKAIHEAGPDSFPWEEAIECGWKADVETARAQARAALAAMPDTDPRPDTYLIWSNEHRAWWGANRSGYTVEFSAAGWYSRDEAMTICRTARDGWGTCDVPTELPVSLADLPLRFHRVLIRVERILVQPPCIVAYVPSWSPDRTVRIPKTRIEPNIVEAIRAGDYLFGEANVDAESEGFLLFRNINEILKPPLPQEASDAK